MGGGWYPTFVRALNDWEMEEVERFLLIIFRRKICTSQEDKLFLKNAKFEGFIVKVMYRVLDCSPFMPFPHCSIWNPIVPPNMGFFTWEASGGKVLTLDQLKIRGRKLTNRCFLCEDDEETIDYLLVHCLNARMLGSFFWLWLASVGFSPPL